MNSLTLFDHLKIPAPTEVVDFEQRSRDAIHEARLKDFKARCPLEFRSNIERAKITSINAWDIADKWKPGEHPGLWLWSHETGRCKTRMAWRKIGQAIVWYGLRYVITSGTGLADLCYENFRDGEPSEFVRRFKGLGFVVIDDVDKFPFNDEKHGRAFRELFDMFYANHVSVLVTSNEPISFVDSKLGESCGRRIHEVCGEIKF